HDVGQARTQRAVDVAHRARGERTSAQSVDQRTDLARPQIRQTLMPDHRQDVIPQAGLLVSYGADAPRTAPLDPLRGPLPERHRLRIEAHRRARLDGSLDGGELALGLSLLSDAQARRAPLPPYLRVSVDAPEPISSAVHRAHLSPPAGEDSPGDGVGVNRGAGLGEIGRPSV